MIKMIAPRGKVIISIDKGDNRLSFDITKIRSGKLVTCGADVSFTEEAGDNATVFFGERVAQIPGDEEAKDAFIVMDEANVYTVYPGA
jgi:hypothetical protein